MGCDEKVSDEDARGDEITTIMTLEKTILQWTMSIVCILDFSHFRRCYFTKFKYGKFTLGEIQKNT